MYKNKCSTSIIITTDNKLLFQIRDINPNILYPNHFALIAGKVENNETPYDAIKREIKEELSIISNKKLLITNPFYLFSFITQLNILEYVFITYIKAYSSELQINEGQGLFFIDKYFFNNDMRIAPHHKNALEYFFNILYHSYKINNYLGGNMKIKDFYKISTLGLKKDYSTMLDTNGFVDMAKTPIASIIPEEAVNYIALLEFVNNVPRGNHLHKDKIEYIVILSGELECSLSLLDNPSNEIEKFNLTRGQTIRILPNCVHTYTAINGDCIALEYSPQNYDPNDTIIFNKS